MRLCRFDDNRLGLVEGEEILDVSGVLKLLPEVRWPVPPGDLLIANLDRLKPEIEKAARDAKRVRLADATLLSPVANPNKIICAPVNYQLHLDESRADKEINFGSEVKTIDDYGLFLKANSALVGAGEGVVSERAERRTDHEVELVAVIGRGGRDIAYDDALSHVAGYCVGLDITIRGTEDRSYRKSLDTFCVLGPWLVTADEAPDPGALEFGVEVDGEVRQRSNTCLLIFDTKKLISYASHAYTLYPGDVIMTGTPEGVSPILPGNTMHAWIEGIGEMNVKVRGRA